MASNMTTLGIDIETFSSANLITCGVYKYVEAPDFTILLFAYSVDGGPVKVVDFTAGERLPFAIREALWDRGVEKTAFNANFERTCIGKYFGRYCPPEEWSCTAVLASTCGLPLHLAEVGPALGFSEEQAKMKEGKALIGYFCKPCHPTKNNEQRTRNLPTHAPEKWEVFKAYNARDVEVEQRIRDILLRWKQSPVERKIWCLDQRINDRGIRVDLTLAANAAEMGTRFKEELLAQAVEISGLENPASTSQIKEWLLEQEGLEVPSLNKKAIPDLLMQLSDNKVKEFMALRTEFSKSSTSKYDAMLRSVTDDEHIHGCFQFAGAGRTGRWAGRLVQLQNLPQNHMTDLAVARALVRSGDYETVQMLYPSVTSALSELIRTALIPEPGHRFVVADFSAIEARVVAWFAGEKWRLDVFADGGDIYCASASQMFHVPVTKGGENGHLRAKGKIAELALGYGGGVNALVAFGANKSMTNEEMVETVDLWRASSPRIVSLWKSLEKAAIRCVVKKDITQSTMGNVTFWFEHGVLWMGLPSGRRVAYFGAEYTDSKFKNGKCLTYMGMNQTTRKWCRIETWGGKLVENLVQATARDCLRDSMLALADEGLDIRAHVHDEVIISEPIGGRSVEEVCALMGQELSWAPGLPLRADGYETPFYLKD